MTEGSDIKLLDYDKLKGRIIEKYGSRRSYAKALGIPESTLSKKLNGKSPFSQEEILTHCKFLDVSIDKIPLYFFTVKVR